MDDLLLPIYVLLIAAFYVFFSWVARKLIDPDGSMRGLPLPGFIRWPVLLVAVLAPTVTVWVLSGILRLLTQMVA